MIQEKNKQAIEKYSNYPKLLDLADERLQSRHYKYMQRIQRNYV